MYNNNFDDIKNLVEEMVDGFNKLKNEWKMKNDDEKEKIVDQIYKTKVEHHLVRCPSTAVEKSEIRHMLEEMYK